MRAYRIGRFYCFRESGSLTFGAVRDLTRNWFHIEIRYIF